ncbi:Uncharacterised protein [uncultured archaeon]|nr:Uncharacterised protein [uncultured archaeon]
MPLTNQAGPWKATIRLPNTITPISATSQNNTVDCQTNSTLRTITCFAATAPPARTTIPLAVKIIATRPDIYAIPINKTLDAWHTITVTETDGEDRTNETVGITLSFPYGSAINTSLHLTDEEGNLIPFAAWNQTTQDDYLTTADIIFPATVNALTNATYYLLYGNYNDSEQQTPYPTATTPTTNLTTTETNATKPPTAIRLDRYEPGLFIKVIPTTEKNISQNVSIPQPNPIFGPNFFIVREMPPQINQQNNCTLADPWNTCAYTSVKLIAFNRGIQNASYVDLLERSLLPCDTQDCRPTSYRCVADPEYYCTECGRQITYAGLTNRSLIQGSTADISVLITPAEAVNRTVMEVHKSNGWTTIQPTATYAQSGGIRFNFTYTIGLSGEHVYRIKTTDSTGITHRSPTYTLVQTASSTDPNAPIVNGLSLEYHPYSRTFNVSVNVTDPDNNLLSVVLEVFDPVSSRSTIYDLSERTTLGTLSSISQALFGGSLQAVYEESDIPATTAGAYMFRIIAEDSAANIVYSGFLQADTSCTLEDQEASRLIFTLKGPVRPRDFRMLHYELLPTRNLTLYPPVNTTYAHNATIYFSGDNTTLQWDIQPGFHYPTVNGSRYHAGEEDPIVNPPDSLNITLANKTAVNYDFDANPSTTKEDRRFNAQTNTTIKLTIHPLTGDLNTGPWNATIKLPTSWLAYNCTVPENYTLTCSINNTLHTINLQGSLTPTSMSPFDIQFTTEAQTDDVFLIPINKTLENLTEHYNPGIFATTLAVEPKNITQNVTRNITIIQPQPIFGPHILHIRESPPQAGQLPTCNITDPWGTCATTPARIYLYNRGIYNATLIETEEYAQTSCNTTNTCDVLSYRCIQKPTYYCVECTQPLQIQNLTDLNLNPGDAYVINPLITPTNHISNTTTPVLEVYHDGTWTTIQPTTITNETTNQTNGLRYTYPYTVATSTENLYRIRVNDTHGLTTTSEIHHLREPTQINGTNSPIIENVSLEYSAFNRTARLLADIYDPNDNVNAVFADIIGPNNTIINTYTLTQRPEPTFILRILSLIFGPTILSTGPNPYGTSQIPMTEYGQYSYRVRAQDQDGNRIITPFQNANTGCTLQENDTMRLHYTLISPMKPRQYTNIEYEWIPPKNATLYETNTTYKFNVSSIFSPPDAILLAPKPTSGYDTYYSNTTRYLAQEDDGQFNPPETKIITLTNTTPYQYDLDTNLSETGSQRQFLTNIPTTFHLSLKSQTVVGNQGAWAATFYLPQAWMIYNCSYVSGPECTCTVNTYPPTLTCSGVSGIPRLSTINLTFNASVPHEYLWSIPSNKTLTNGLTEEYLPGLFVVSELSQPINISIPTTITVTSTIVQPQPQPVPYQQPVTTLTYTTTTVTVPERGEGPNAGTTQISVHIEPVDRAVTGEQGANIPFIINITNLGDYAADNITIEPVITPGWNATSAMVTSIGAHESLLRTVFVVPPYTASGVYVVPVRALRFGDVLDIDYVWVTVLAAANRYRLNIEEVPPALVIKAGEKDEIPLLLRNIGYLNLRGITAKIENAEPCLNSYNWDKIDILRPKQLIPASITLNAKDQSVTCEATIIVSTNEDAYTYAPITLTVSPPPGRLPQLARSYGVFVLMLLILTAMIVVKTINQRIKSLRKKMEQQQRRPRPRA